MGKLSQIWIYLRSSLWFVPTLLVLGSIVLASALIFVDTQINRELLLNMPLLFGAGAEGSRGMLSAIAGSMITVAGVTFSITIVALSLASSQFSPRVLRNFMGDRANQVVLGAFVGIFTYCLVVLRTIRGGDEGTFIPALSVLFGFALALTGVGLLIFFIHHIASSIQASSILASAAGETAKAVDRLFPQELGEEADDEDEGKYDGLLRELKWRAVPSSATGYIQNVDTDALMRFARERQALVRMERGIGDFVIKDTPIASISGGGELNAVVCEGLNECYTVNHYRTVEQDAAFGIQQIVDVALRALSTGVNDTTTAAMCVDYLAAILTRLVRRRIESDYRSLEGELRVIARGPDFQRLVDQSFTEIRRNAGGNVVVLKRLLDALRTVGRHSASARRRRVLKRHVELIEEQAAHGVEIAHDREEVELAAARAREAIEEEPGEPVPVLEGEGRDPVLRGATGVSRAAD